MTKYAKVTPEGFFEAIVESNISSEDIPEGHVEITDENWIDLLFNQRTRRYVDGKIVEYTPPPPPATEPIPYDLPKQLIWQRATDEEAEALDQLLKNTPVKLRRQYQDAAWLNSGDPLFTTLREAIAQVVGEARADELLADPNAQPNT